VLKQQEASSVEVEQLRGVSLGHVGASATTLEAKSVADRARMPVEAIVLKPIFEKVKALKEIEA
jgi:hypothetical protein